MRPRLLPLGIDIGLLRQGAQGRPIQGVEGRLPRARQLLERSGVEPLEQHGDGAVELVQREELAIPQGGEDPALDHLHADLSLGLVARFTGPRRHHRHAVMFGQVAVAGVDVRLVAMRFAHRTAQVVRHHDLRDPVEEGEAAGVRAQPVRQLLRPGSLGEGVAGGTEHRDEHLRLADLAAVTVDHRHRLPGVVDEQLLAGAVLLAHHHIQPSLPGAVVVAEPAVLIALRVRQSVLLPEQRQGHARTAQLGLDRRPVGQWSLLAGHRGQRREQPSFQLGIRQAGWQWPGQPGSLAARQIVANGGAANLHAGRDLPGRQPRLELEA
ncbi:hypothetical protein D3C85_907730 [compost metagenome]